MGQAAPIQVQQIFIPRSFWHFSLITSNLYEVSLSCSALHGIILIGMLSFWMKNGTGVKRFDAHFDSIGSQIWHQICKILQKSQIAIFWALGEIGETSDDESCKQPFFLWPHTHILTTLVKVVKMVRMLVVTLVKMLVVRMVRIMIKKIKRCIAPPPR